MHSSINFKSTSLYWKAYLLYEIVNNFSKNQECLQYCRTVLLLTVRFNVLLFLNLQINVLLTVISYMDGTLLWANNYLRPHRVRYFSIRIHSSGMVFKQMFFIKFLRCYIYWRCAVINKSFHYQQNMTCFNYLLSLLL